MIPKHIIEKAASAMQEFDCPGIDWDECVDSARVTVESVYADIQAEAIRDIAELFKKPRFLWHGGTGVEVLTDPDDFQTLTPIQVWLHNRADELDGGEHCTCSDYARLFAKMNGHAPGESYYRNPRCPIHQGNSFPDREAQQAELRANPQKGGKS